MVTDVAVFPVSSQEALDLANKSTSLIVLYATCPIVFASGDEHLLGIRRHGAIDALFALNVQASWRLPTLACWYWAFLNRRHWRRRERYVDARGVASAG